MTKKIASLFIKTAIFLIVLLLFAGQYLNVDISFVYAHETEDFIQTRNAGAGEVLKIENSDFIRLNDQGSESAEGYVRFTYKDAVKLEGLTVSVYSDYSGYNERSFFGFFFNTKERGNCWFKNDSQTELGVAVFKHKTQSLQDRVVISYQRASEYPSVSQGTVDEIPCAYIEPDINSKKASAVIDDGTWIQTIDSPDAQSGISVTFSSYNEEWYKLDIAHINASTYKTETDVLYVQKSQFLLDDNGKTFIYFGMKYMTTMCVKLDFAPEADPNDEITDCGDYVATNVEEAESSDSGIRFTSVGKNNSRVAYKYELDLEKNGGIYANFLIDTLAETSDGESNKIIFGYQRYYNLYPDQNGLVIEITVGDSPAVLVKARGVEVVSKQLSGSMKEGDNVNLYVVYGPVYNSDDDVFENGYTVEVNGETVAEFSASTLPSTSLNPNKSYFVVANSYSGTGVNTFELNKLFYGFESEIKEYETTDGGIDNYGKTNDGIYFELNGKGYLYCNTLYSAADDKTVELDLAEINFGDEIEIIFSLKKQSVQSADEIFTIIINRNDKDMSFGIYKNEKTYGSKSFNLADHIKVAVTLETEENVIKSFGVSINDNNLNIEDEEFLSSVTRKMLSEMYIAFGGTPAEGNHTCLVFNGIKDKSETVVTHTVRFLSEDDTELATLTVTDGQTVQSVPEAPEVEGKNFIGWKDMQTGELYTDLSEFSITSDTTFKAVYENKSNTGGGDGTTGTSGCGCGSSIGGGEWVIFFAAICVVIISTKKLRRKR